MGRRFESCLSSQPDWRSGSAALLHSDGHKFESCIGHNPPSRWAFYYQLFIMTKRLMTDRDHLEALVTAVENLSRDKDAQYSVMASPAVQRLLRAAERASQDLYPEG